MRAGLMVVVVVGVLSLSTGASAGPPHGVCRHLSRQRCEEVLGPYSAARFLDRHVMEKLRPRLTGASGGTLYCNAPRKGHPWVFRCGETVERGGLPAPCTVDALVARNKHKVFRFAWLKESASCGP